MAKKNPSTMTNKDREDLFLTFCIAITLLSSVKEVKSFFVDLLTPTEALMLARRLKVAEMIMEGMTYNQIKEELGVGTATISKVHYWLEEGHGGYKKILSELFAEKKNQEKRIGKRLKKQDPFSIESFKRKYILYFWPEELIKEIEPLIIGYLKKQKKKASIKKSIQKHS